LQLSAPFRIDKAELGGLPVAIGYLEGRLSMEIVATLLGILVGGLITLLALRIQLWHESKEKERERQLTLRRDVYLDTMEAIGRAQTFLAGFSREDLDVPQLLEKLEGIPSALGKAQLVTSEATFEAVEDFGYYLTSSSLDLLLCRLRVKGLQSEIESQQGEVAQLESRLAHTNELLGRISQDDAIHARMLLEVSDLGDALTAAQGLLQEMMSRHVEATEELGRKTLQVTLDAQVEIGKIVIQMRREIELPLNEEWYLMRLEQRKKRMQPKIDEAYKGVEEVLGETDRFHALGSLAERAPESAESVVSEPQKKLGGSRP
jgi:hypothetical protein